MLTILKKLRKRDWVVMAIIIGLTIMQVWFTMMMVDRMADLIQSITFISYNHDPSQLPDEMQAAFNMYGSWEAMDAAMQAAAAQGAIEQSVADTVHSIATANASDVWYAGGLMLGVAALSSLTQVLVGICAAFIASNLATNLRRAVNGKVSSFSLAEINRFSTASLITRSGNDIEQVQFSFLLVMRMVFAAPVTAIWAICKVQATSLELTAIIAAAVVALIVVVITLMTLAIPKFKISQKLVDRLNGVTRENINGIRVIHAYNAEGYQEGKFKKANDDLTKLNLFTGRVLGLFSPFMTIIMDGVTLGMYWLGGSLINANKLTYATMSSFTMLASQIIMSFMMLLMMFIMLPRALVSAKRISEVLHTEPSIVESKNPVTPTEKGTIEFDDVGFAYPDADTKVIEHVSFKAKQGDTVAIIGSTGCGKTTLINLMARLYDATEGTVKVDGVDVKDIGFKDLRNRIGFVPQKGVLFSGTVKSNIAFGAPTATQEDIEKAAQIACADEFIESMEGKYDAPISQGGKNVSGGQRQRLCIARAVATKPEILIFDDSFSALDFKTDLKVRRNLKESQEDATKVIVAQRIGTIMEADLILVLEEGQVVGQGKHKDLLRDCDVYRSIALSQLSKEELGL
ncbi:MAG: ABC transporter ATP-binding protein/permease [Bacilli bacterium]|nr:ABC transporter ATP-binding protein/permease [Bacilli bacterium]